MARIYSEEIASRRRSVLSLIGVIFICLFVMAFYTHIDIVTYASGTLIVPERTKEIVSPFSGPLIKLSWSAGEQVTQGQLLAELDRSSLEAEIVKLNDSIHQTETNIVRFKEFLKILDSLGSSRDKFIGVTSDDQLLRALIGSLTAQLTANSRQQEENQQLIIGSRLRLQRLESMVKRDEILQDQRKSLLGVGFISQSAILQAENLADERQLELSDARLNVSRAEVTVNRLNADRMKIIEDAKAAALRELENLNASISSLVKSSNAVRFKMEASAIVSPVNGTIEDVRVTTVPTTVTAGQLLLKVVPRTGDLIVEGRIQDREIGFAKAGQTCRAKVDAFPFTRYGTLRCQVTSIARDREALDKGLFVFRAKLASTKASEAISFIDALRPGMGVTVDIVTGTRSLFSYLVDPVLEIVNDALSER